MAGPKLLWQARSVRRSVSAIAGAERVSDGGVSGAPECPQIGNGPNTVSGSTVSNPELSEFFWAHRVPGRELSEFLTTYYLCAKANSPSFFSQNSLSSPQNSVRLSEFSSPKQYSRKSIPPDSQKSWAATSSSIFYCIIRAGIVRA